MKIKLITRIIALTLALVTVILPLSGCFAQPKINGIDLGQYTIVYSDDAPDYNKRAAEYIRDTVKQLTGVELAVLEEDVGSAEHEIVVGETSREISKTLDAATEGVEFAIMADDNHIALEGDYFVIAAAAYFFVDSYISASGENTEVPKEIKIHEPIVKDAKNFIFLIGDGMGINQTRLYDIYDVPTEGDTAYSDGEDLFYGYMLPYMGMSRTASLDGVTDSAAGGTALTSGYKTHNEYIGKDKDGKDLKSLTELAASLGKATAVMSTESKTGATPAAFSAHSYDRNTSDDIIASQIVLTQTYGTIINCGYDYYAKNRMTQIESKITDVLGKLSEDKDGFFMMYEEAHIDKHCHNNDFDQTFLALMRFNQAIGRFMEYAFYNPDTFVLITADHETGGVIDNGDGTFSYTETDHTSADVRIFTWGKGAELFDGVSIENTQIPMTVADLMGYKNFGDVSNYTSLAN